MNIEFIINRLEKLQRFDLENYVENECSVETERVNCDDGEYIESYDIDMLIRELKQNI